MKVLKFGGTSLGSAQRIKQVAEIISRENHCIVVCSAMAGVTDTLQEISSCWSRGNKQESFKIKADLLGFFEKHSRELFSGQYGFFKFRDQLIFYFDEMEKLLRGHWTKQKEMQLLALGEVITSRLLQAYFLTELTQEIKRLDAFEFLHLNQGGDPSVSDIAQKLKNNYGKELSGRLITQGFICLDNSGGASNLGRGGSDFTATLLGAAIEASSIEIWTDIDGLRNNDPRYVDNTKALREISYAEAAELAYFGAKILHPACVWPASRQNIPIFLKNTLNPGSPGTAISGNVRASGIRAISAKSGISMVRIESARMLNAYGFLRRVFEIFDQWETPIDVITTSEVSISLTIDNPYYLEEIAASLEKFGKVTIEREQAIICVVGDVLACRQEHAGRIMKAMKPFQVNMLSFGGSRNNLTAVLPAKEKKDALQALHQQLFLQTQVPVTA